MVQNKREGAHTSFATACEVRLLSITNLCLNLSTMRLGLIALLLLCPGFLCLCTSQSSAFGAKRKDILLLGQKAVNKWLQENKLNCGWEDGTFMIGESLW